MNVKQQFIDNYVELNNLENSRVIEYEDEKHFEYVSIDEIGNRLGLPDSCIKDENGNIKYGYLKDFSGEEMRLVIGYTGSGKSMRDLLPKLLASIKSGHSVIVTDISGQLLDYSYNFLKEEGVDIKVLNLFDPELSNTYNPLLYEAQKVKESGRILDSTNNLGKNLASIIFSLKSSKDPNWNKGAQNIFFGVFLGAFEALIKEELEVEDINLYNIIQQCFWLIRRISRTNSITLLKDIEYYSDKDQYSDSIMTFAANVECSPVTRSGYFSCFNDNISEINYSSFYKLTSSSTFTIDEFLNRQTALFINTGGKKAGDVLIGVIINQLYDAINDRTIKSISKKLERPIQLFLDEFANINFGDSDKVREIFTTTRKNQLFFNMYIQNYNQLRIKFGEDSFETIVSNSTHYFLGATDYKTREEFANNCGKRTIESTDSFTKNSVVSLKTVNLINPNSLNKLSRGHMYINGRQGFDTILTYFEAAYNLNEFKPTKDYEYNYNNPNVNYKDNIMIQPLMFKPIDLTNYDISFINEYLDNDIYEYFKLVEYDIRDFIMVKKFLKLGLIKIKNNKIISTLSKDKYERLKAMSSDSRNKRFNWEV